MTRTSPPANRLHGCRSSSVRHHQSSFPRLFSKAPLSMALECVCVQAEEEMEGKKFLLSFLDRVARTKFWTHEKNRQLYCLEGGESPFLLHIYICTAVSGVKKCGRADLRLFVFFLCSCRGKKLFCCQK